jgi:hypothetical protein
MRAREAVAARGRIAVKADKTVNCNDEAFRELEVLCNLCAITQSVCEIRNACLLFQNAARREWRADPAVRESVVSLLQQATLCTSKTSFF